ncbi:MAG: hypothetical protein ACXVBE_11750 [Bdellovibrionota bacterium]
MKRVSLLFFVSLAAGLLANHLAGIPQNIDASISANLWAALFFQFLLWLLAIRGWGAKISHLLGYANQEAGLAFGLGSFFYALIAFALGALGLLRPELRWALILLNSVGVALNPKIRLPRPGFILAVAAMPLVLILLLAGLDALVIHPYWDPLHHHLLGPRLWWEHGGIYFSPDAISAYQEGGFEQLFLWPHFFFARSGGLGLLPVQIFSQLIHCVLGFGGSILLAWSLLKKEITAPSSRLFTILLFAIPASLQFGIPTAKNDWGIVLWTLTGFVLLLEGRTRSTAAAGLVFGFTLMAKISAVYAILPILLTNFYFFPAFRTLKMFAALSAGVLFGVLPLAIRNYVGAGDPFFPLFAGFFPHSALGPTWKEALLAYQTGHQSFYLRIGEWGREFLFAPALLALPLLFLKTESKVVRTLAVSLPLSLLLFLATAGAPAELRLLGACLPISGLLAGILLDRLLMRLPYSESLPLVLIAVAIPFLPIRWDALARRDKIFHPEAQARSYIGSEAQAWFRKQFVPGQKAALLVDTRLYHSVPYPIVRIWDAPLIDAKLRDTKSPEEFLQTLKELGFSHLILTQEKLDLFYPRELVSQVEGWVLAHDHDVVFRTPYSMVLDLKSF